ncbi:MAG: bacillithiol biosynthesis BshC, partial [Gemmatimonadaceae bacterium]
MTVRVISVPLRGKPLTQAAISGLAGSRWFVPHPAGAAEWNRRADEMRGALVDSNWMSSLAPAIGASGPAADRLLRAATSGFAVTTGQQPGLFGGPLYTWWKALSALALANDLERLTGRPVAPIFWAATDDSDFTEAAKTVVAMHGKSVTIEIARLGGEGGALAGMPLGDVRTQLDQLALAAGSAPHAGILDKVRAAYTPDHTIGSAYVQLLRAVLNPLGIAVIDASHEAVRSAAYPVLRSALRTADSIESALESRASDLAAAGHTSQVKLVKGRSLVFTETNGKRARVSLRDASAIAETAESVELGANVLLRPIVERSIIPTVAYVGGP